MAEIVGTAGNDTLSGTIDPDTIDGLDGDDTLSGLGGDDSLNGGAGDDDLFGGEHDDTLFGGLDSDLLDGGDGNDTLDGGAGIDQLLGSAGNDTMFAEGGDSVNGGAGDDALIVRDGLGAVYDGGTDTDTLTLDFTLAASGVAALLTNAFNGFTSGSIGSATVSGFEAISGTIYGSGFDDQVNIGDNYSGALTMVLGAGNDSAIGGSGADTLDGGAGSDSISAGAGADSLSDYDGVSYLYGDGGDDAVTIGALTGGTVSGGGDTDRLNFDFSAAAAGVYVNLNAASGTVSGTVGGASIDTFELLDGIANIGSGFDDVISIGAGYAGATAIDGAGGNDQIGGGSGIDTLSGGDGNDVLDGHAGADILTGGMGNDSYGVDNIGDVVTEGPGGGIDIVTSTLNTYTLGANLENLVMSAASGQSFGHGNALDNTLTLTTSFSSALYGNGGNDTINGSAFFDQLFGGDGDDTVNAGGGGDVAYGEAGNDTLNGEGGNDILLDSAGTNTFNGGDGGDLIVFDGNALNSATGGSGHDRLEIRANGRTSAFAIDLTGMWSGGSGVANGGTVSGFEELVDLGGTQWNDIINLGAGASVDADITDAGLGDDILTGTEGSNYIAGGEGNDTIVSGAGATDELHGGEGNDTITIGALTAGWVYGGAGTDTLGVGPAQAGAFNIDLTAVWSGGTGFVNGVAVSGIELLETDFIQSDHFVNGVADSVVIGAGYAENVTMLLGRGADSATGGSGNDTISGEHDNDVIRGGAGNDSLGGSYGSDTVYGDAGDDTITGDTLDLEFASGDDYLYGGDGNDTMDGGAFADGLYGEAGNDVLRGDSLVNGDADHGGDTLDGGAGSDQLFGYGGNDILLGGLGNDAMTGGVGNDRYYVDNAADAVFETAGQGNDTVLASASYTLAAGSHVESLGTTNVAGTGAINLTGNDLANIIVGNAGNNQLIGGGGADTMQGLGGDDRYYVDHLSDRAFEAVGGGNDILLTSIDFVLTAGQSIESLSTNVQAGFDAIDITGNELANTIAGNQGANVLDGGGGADRLQGLGGDDRYYVDNAGDVLFEALGGGNDIVLTGVDYVLSASAHVESLTTRNQAGTEAIDIIANDIANIVVGNAGANVLRGQGGNDIVQGLAGNDLLYGGLGADRLFGGAGNDQFVFNTALGAGNADKLEDYAVASDVIVLDRSNFAGIAANGVLAAGAFRAGAAAADADDRIVYNAGTGQLFYDADGSGAGAQMLFATVTPGTALTNLEFVAIA